MARKRDRVYWVLQKRTALFGWKALHLYKTKRTADIERAAMEKNSKLGILGYKVDRVELVD